METKHIATLAGALGAGAALGLTIGVAWRYKGLDTNCRPLPLMAEVPAGTERSALEIDNANMVRVRSNKAAELLILLNDYELVPVDAVATPAEKAEYIVAAFNLKPKSTTQGPLHVGFPATAYLASAAKEGFDVLINDRVTALLDKRPIQSPKVAPTVRTSDILIVKTASTATSAPVHDPGAYSSATFGAGTPDWYTAILILGDAAGSKTLPTPPGGFAKGAIVSEAEKVAKAVASGVASRARHTMRLRLFNGAQLSNRPYSSMGPMPRLRG